MKKLIALALAGAGMCVASQASAATILTINARGTGIMGSAPMTISFVGTFEVPTTTTDTITVTQGGGPTAFNFTFKLPEATDLGIDRVLAFASGGGTFFSAPYTGGTSFQYGSITVSQGSLNGNGGGSIGYSPLALPEPAGWAMMIAGFCLAGAALRHRERFALA